VYLIAQLVARWLVVKQAQIQISARDPPILLSDEKNPRQDFGYSDKEVSNYKKSGIWPSNHCFFHKLVLISAHSHFSNTGIYECNAVGAAMQNATWAASTKRHPER
jgi:hypothetical protein